MLLETRHLRLVGAVAEHGTLTRAPRAQPHAVRFVAPAARSRDEARAAAVSPARQTHGAHARGRAPVGGGAACVTSARGRRRRLAAAGRRPGRDPAREHRMLHLLSLAAGCVSAVYAPLSPGRCADRGGGDPPPVPALLDGRIDLAIVSNDDHDDRLSYVPLFTDELVALLRPDHPLSAKPFLS